MAARLLRALSLLVPSWRRGEWLEEWEAELSALVSLRASQAEGYPGELAFVAGAIPHAAWLRREEWSMSGVAQDIRYAVRLLVRSPGFSLVAVLTLALGIGANASMFALVNGLLFREPPVVSEPARLVQIARSYEDAPRWDNFSWPALLEIRRATTAASIFEGVAGHSGTTFVIGEGAGAETVGGLLVTGNWFGVTGVPAAVGRTIEASDDLEPGAHPVVVLGHGLWQRRFGGERSAVGSTLRIGGVAYEIIGVAPDGFKGLEAFGGEPGLYLPAAMHPPFRGELPFAEWGTSWISLVGRLAPGVTFEAARAAMPAVSAALRAAAPVNDGIEVLLAEGVGLDPEARAQAGRVSLLLLAIAALVLLLTCANVANLFLARATARAQEMGVRLALGAGRARATRQLLTESVLLSVLAAAFAYPLVRAAAGALPALIPGGLVWSLAPDARVIAAMLGLGVLAGLLFGVFPAIAAARGGAVAALAANRATGGLGHTRVRDGLVVFQLAISLGLMTASALLGRSVLNAGSAEPGFNPRGLLVAFVAPGLTGRYDGEQALAFYDRLLDDLRGMPGVVSVTVATSSPLTGPQSRATRFPADRPDDPAVQFEAEAINVGPDYFETMGIPLIRGRALLGWRQEPEPVAVINQAAADFYWPGQDPIGKEFGGDGQRRTRVVGVVGDVQQRSLRRAAAPAVYQPLSAENFAAAFHLRTAGRPLDLARPVRERVALLDPGLPVMSLTDLQAAVAASIGETRTFGWLVTAFAGLAFALSIIGLYGLVSYAVSRRVREMGIRMALGAEPRRLIGMVLARGLTLTGVGIVTGLAVAWALSRALQGLLFGVSATNPAALAAASLLLLMAATLAAWLPARRAGRTDAVASLRD